MTHRARGIDTFRNRWGGVLFQVVCVVVTALIGGALFSVVSGYKTQIDHVMFGTPSPDQARPGAVAKPRPEKAKGLN